MYTFSSKLKTFSFVLMAVGLLGIGYGFLTAPKDIQEVEKLLAAESHGGHGEAKHEATTAAEPSHEAAAGHSEATEEKKIGESHEAVAPTGDTTKVAEEAHAEPVHAEADVKKEGHHVS